MKIKKNKILIFFSTFAIGIWSTSCSVNSNDEIVFLLGKSSNDSEKKFMHEVEKAFNINKINTKFQNKEYTFKFKNIDSTQVKKDLLENGTGTFGFFSCGSLFVNDFYNKCYPSIQTLTNSFSFDKSFITTSDTGGMNNLTNIANEIQKSSFGLNYEYPFSSWNNESGPPPNYDWNGIRYNHFYSDELVDFYRGMIVLSGPQNSINLAIKYWNEKNWDSFRNLGIIIGESNSYGSYKLQEKLIIEHFGLENFSIENDRLNHKDKYLTDTLGGKYLGKYENYVINFLDECSFAWTNNKENPDLYSPINDWPIKILTVTNPMKYDIGCFTKNIDKDLANILSQSILDVWSLNNDNYGRSQGYNGYQKINNFQNEVIDKISKYI